MALQTDDFAAPAAHRLVGPGAASPNELSFERALRPKALAE